MHHDLPTFSIYIESANLRLAKLHRLEAALQSICRQEPSPDRADEVVLLEDGALPESVLDELRSRYPWLTTNRISAGLTYGDQKAEGVGRLRSDVIIFADSDCVYRRGWLSALLDAFAKHPEAGAVAGETTIPITGPFTLAAAFFFFFPRFSGERTPAAARGFYFNNAAFRKCTVEEHPIDLGLPLRGGQNVIYARQLNAAAVPILRQPLAQCEHAPPETLWMAMMILFWTGSDTARFDWIAPAHASYSGDYEPYGAPAARLRKLRLRLSSIARQQPFALAWLPIAVPILGLVFGAFFVGRLTARWFAGPLRQ